MAASRALWQRQLHHATECRNERQGDMQAMKWMAVAAVAGLFLSQGCSTMCEKTVVTVPPAAQKTIDQYAEGGKICETEMENEHGMVFYEVKVMTADGARLKIAVNADGKLYKFDRKACRCPPKPLK